MTIRSLFGCRTRVSPINNLDSAKAIFIDRERGDILSRLPVDIAAMGAIVS